MPISRRVFESPGDPWSQLVLEFLRANAEEAFTLAQILDGLLDQGFAIVETDLEATLLALVMQGRVGMRLMLGDIYYSYATAIGYRTQ